MLFFGWVGLHAQTLRPFAMFPPGLQALLDDTAVLETGSSQLRAGISYMFVDFKYRDDSIKICEFGGCNNVCSGDKHIWVDAYGQRFNCITPCWDMFWQCLSQYNLPVWYVGKSPSTEHKGQKFSPAEHLAWNQFRIMGGHHAVSLAKLEHDPVFIAAEAKNKAFNVADMSTYSGIVMVRWFGYSKKKLEKMNRFKQKYPHFLVVDECTKQFSARKSSGVSLFADDTLREYKPRWGLYPRVYDPELSQKIIEDIKSDRVVIKPTKSSQSKGVIIVEKELLNDLLKIILPSEKKRIKKTFWSTIKDESFLVEEFCESKTITVRGRMYDATMRMFFIVRSDQGKIYATVLGGYWKIPPKALSEVGTITEKHKTYAFMSKDFTALPISTEDTQNARALLKNILPHIYLKMVERTNTYDPLVFELQ